MDPIAFPITALASSSDLLVAASGPSLLLHRKSTQNISTPSNTEPFPLIRHIAISPDSTYIATASEDKFLRVYSASPYTLLSTRAVSKKCSDLSFSPSSTASEPNIIYTDKVGDVYLYPLTPREIIGERPTPMSLQSDPTLNPDADFLLGHVSILTASVLTPCGKYIITSDRDEHIRVSRFPRSFVIERYLFGSDGFVSALHIPEASPSTLISAGGEQWMRFWDRKTGKLVGKLDIYSAVLPHRRARTPLRRVKVKRGSKEVPKPAPADLPTEGSDEAFYTAPEGFMLPSGQGVCIKKIRSVQIGGQTIIVFFSEGAAAIHSFQLSLDTTPIISTLSLPSPVLDFTISSSSQIIISLDSAWGILKQNPSPGVLTYSIDPPSPTPELEARLSTVLVAADVTNDGLTLLPEHPIITALQPELAKAPAAEIAKCQLYPLLPLLPRWAGMEEDDELAGPAAAETTEEGGDEKRTYTKEELSKMGNKALGRLKSQGVAVDEFFKKKIRGPRGGGGAKKRRTREKVDGDEDEAEADEGEDVDIEAQMNES